MRRMLEILRPKTETRLNSWSSCIPNYKDTTRKDCFSEVIVMLITKFRSYFHSVVEKLAENVSTQWKNKKSFVRIALEFCQSINLLKSI